MVDYPRSRHLNEKLQLLDLLNIRKIKSFEATSTGFNLTMET
jgi:hypothetical protein